MEGSGNGEVQLLVDANPTTDTRSGTVMIGSRMVTVAQDASQDDPPPTPPGNEVVEYFHLDALGSVRLVTAQDQHAVAAYDYLPFGGNALGTTDDANTRRFTGQERDTTTGYGSAWQPLDYFGARYYQSDSGRFTSTDPLLDIPQAIFDPQRWNRYAYALNNPLRYIDPLALMLRWCAKTPWTTIKRRLQIVL